MPKDTSSGTVPPSKSQRNKAAKLAKLAKKGGAQQHGGKCTRCGQSSSSSTPGETHLGCPDKALWGFELAYRLRAYFMKKYVGAEGKGIWLSTEDYAKYEIEVDAYLASVRNFSTENMRWENAYGEPINFLTGEVLVEEESAVENAETATSEVQTEALTETQEVAQASA